ncbi:hypothetical protein BJY04DRAFT_2156 [Aspergillus karnatakaensis]|uniref:uncharacterized protein n=1 Tax=Aspergillus karnatakaensis TaxID=1810916 RepID=UPI003CCDF70A
MSRSPFWLELLVERLTSLGSPLDTCHAHGPRGPEAGLLLDNAQIEAATGVYVTLSRLKFVFHRRHHGQRLLGLYGEINRRHSPCYLYLLWMLRGAYVGMEQNRYSMSSVGLWAFQAFN